MRRFAVLAVLLGGVLLAVAGGGSITSAGAAPTPGDRDGDGVVNASDNCTDDYNPDQTDSNSDARGDRCDFPAGIPAGESWITAYPRESDGDPLASGCATWTDYVNGVPGTPVTTCGPPAWQSHVVMPDTNVDQVDVELASPSGCGGSRTATFYPSPDDHQFFDPCPDLQLEKYADHGVVGAGEAFTYTIAVWNNGTEGAGSATVTDKLPAGFVFQSADPSQGSCSESSGTVTCPLGDLGGYGGAIVEIHVVAPSTAGLYTNHAEVASTGGDSNPENNSFDADVRVGVGADVIVQKYVSEDPAPNEPVHFEIFVWNDGPQAAHDVLVADALGANSTITEITPSQGPSCSLVAHGATCPLGTIAAGDFATIQVVVSGIAEGVIRNTATARLMSAPADPDLTSNRDAAAAVVGSPQLADLSIGKWGPRFAAIGQPYTYEVWVWNNGPQTAHNVEVTDFLPAGMTFSSVTIEYGAGTCGGAPDYVACTITDLAVDDGAFIEITVTPNQLGTVTNGADVVAESPADPEPDGDTSFVDTTVVPAGAGDLWLFKQGDDVAGEGVDYVYTLTAYNDGPSPTSAQIVDTLPVGMTFKSASAGCTHNNGTVTCDLGTIGVYDSRSVAITVTPTAGATAQGTVTNVAHVISADDPDDSNDESEVVTDVFPPGSADLEVTKVATPSPAVVGETLKYTVRVHNRGPLTSGAVTLDETVPVGTSLVSATPSSGTCAPPASGHFVCNLLPVAPRGTATVSVNVTPHSTTQLTNTVSVSHNGAGGDPESGNDSATLMTNVVPNVADEVEATSQTGQIVTDPDTGEVTVSMPRGQRSPITITTHAVCPPGTGSPVRVDLRLNEQTFPMTPIGGDDFSVTIPANDVDSGTLSVVVTCSGAPDPLTNEIGQIQLYDPSGIVTDKNTHQPIEGATVTLYNVPGWAAKVAADDTRDDTCQSALSKADPSDPWNQPAPTGEGVVANPSSGLIDPAVNPQLTTAQGRYGWDVAAGCWYVVVSKAGYNTLTSPVVGVPPAVTDLDLELVPVAVPPQPQPPAPQPQPPAPQPQPPAPQPQPPAPQPQPPAPKPKPKPKVVKLTICHNGKTKKVTKKQLQALRKQVAKANKKKGAKKVTLKMGACKKKAKKR